jgi:alkylhydroperoxidase family enzyme
MCGAASLLAAVAPGCGRESSVASTAPEVDAPSSAAFAPSSTPPQPPSFHALELRYQEAWKRVGKRDYDGALDGLRWLWEHTPDRASMEQASIREAVVDSAGRLAPVHEPTRIEFTAILDGLEESIRQDPLRLPGEWSDWAELSRAMGQQERVIRLYEEWRRPDGTLDTHIVNYYGWVTIIDALLEQGRFADVGRIHPDLVDEAERKLSSTDDSLEMDPDMVDWYTKQDLELLRQEDREDVALLCAAGLAAGRASESEQVAKALLAKYDSVESRRALVEACLRVGVFPDALPRWISELQERGEDVTELTIALMEARNP